MEYSVVHTACGTEMFKLSLPIGASVADVVTIAKRLLAEDHRKTGQYVRQWPLECDNEGCGKTLSFNTDPRAGNALEPIVRVEGTTIFHD